MSNSSFILNKSRSKMAENQDKNENNTQKGNDKKAFKEITPEMKAAIKTVFDSFDADKSGYIDQKEIKLVAEQLGEKVDDEEIDRIFSEIDTNKDGKISLSEFSTWWCYGKVNKLEKLVYYKFKALKLLNKSSGFKKRMGSALQGKYELKDGVFKFVVQTTEDPSKTSLKFKVIAGKEAESRFAQITHGHDNLNEEVALLIKFKIEGDVGTAKTNLKDAIENLIQFLSSISEEAGAFLENMIKIDYIEGEGSIILSISVKDKDFFGDLNDFQNDFKELYDMGVSAIFEGELGFKNDFEVIAKDKGGEKLVNSIFEGLRFSLEAKTKPNILEILRKQTFEEFEDYYDPRRYILMLIKNGKMTVNLAEMAKDQTEAFLNGIGALEHYNQTPSPKELMDLAKDADIADLLKNIPPAQKLLEFLGTHCKADLKIYAKIPNILAMLEFETKGLGEIYDYIMKKQDQTMKQIFLHDFT